MGANILTFATCSVMLMSVILSEAKESKSNYCGSRLASTLSLLCEGVYAKRANQPSHNHLDVEGNSMSDYEVVDGNEFFRDREGALALIGPRLFRYKRDIGVAEECCRNPCTLTELSYYCGNDTNNT